VSVGVWVGKWFCVRVCVCVWVWVCGCGCGMDAFFVFMTVLKCSLIGIERHEYFIGNTKR